MGDPTLWIPAGNWAEWVGSVLAGGSLVGLVVGLRGERRARRQDETDRALEQRRNQARSIGAWIEPAEDDPGGQVWILYVTNQSDLPIRKVIGYLFRPDGRPTGASLPIPVVPPRSTATMRVRLEQPFLRADTKHGL